MKIAIATDTYAPQVNGVTTVLRRMVSALRSAGHQVAVLAPLYPGQEKVPANGQVRVRSLAFPPYPDIRLAIPPYGEARRYLEEFSPDLVHVATEGLLGLIGRRFALRKRIPLVTSFHTDFPRYCHDYGVAALEPLVWRWLLWFHRPARITQTPGEAVRQRLLDRGLSHAVLWGRGIDVSTYHPDRRDRGWRHRHGIADDSLIVLHVGRLAREKNLDVLVEAWALARQALGPRAEFLLVGQGPVAAELEARAPWARRLGFLDREELARVYANSDICVLPSDTETLGLVALEAMASGSPVVAADAGGFRETIRDGENGLLAPAHDPAAFAERIIRLAHDDKLRRALAFRARATAEERDEEIENASLIDQYQRVISTFNPGR